MQTETCEINPWFFFFLILLLACERLLKLENIQPLIIADTSVSASDKAADPFPAPPLAFCCREVNVVFNLSTAFRFYSGIWLNYIGQSERVNYCSIVQDFKPVKSHILRFNLHFQSSVRWLELWLWMYLVWASIFYILEQEFFADLNVKLQPGVNLSDFWESFCKLQNYRWKICKPFLDCAQIFCLLIDNCRNSNKLT